MPKSGLRLSLPLLIGFMAVSLSAAAGSGSIEQKLEQCKKEFALAHSGGTPQETAAAANLRHLKLMKEILQELNTRNANRKLSPEELQENVMVMSHLLEMLVTENLARKEQSWGVNY